MKPLGRSMVFITKGRNGDIALRQLFRFGWLRPGKDHCPAGIAVPLAQSGWPLLSILRHPSDQPSHDRCCSVSESLQWWHRRSARSSPDNRTLSVGIKKDKELLHCTGPSKVLAK